MSKKPTPAPWTANTHEPVRDSMGDVRHRISGEHSGDKIIGMTETDYLHALRCVNRCAELAKPAPVAAPEGWQLVPKELTAENGAKAALIGEFVVEQEINCPECDADEHDVGDCLLCHGEGFVRNKIPVPWTAIKLIWRRAIEHFSAAPQPPAPAVDVEAIREALKYLSMFSVNHRGDRIRKIYRAIGDET